MGQQEFWEKATKDIEAAAREKKIPFEIGEGEAAFYGPKLDFLVKDSLGREWQLGTIQVDPNLPERFDLTYIGADDKRHRPVIIHRAPFGSLERFIGILIEHFGGNFPLWLSPVQIKILTVADRHEKYAKKLFERFVDAELRVEMDLRNETIPAKVRGAQLEKVPLILVVGDKEEKAGTVTVRTRAGKLTPNVKVEDFLKSALKNIGEKKIDLD
jgi:threonyl-tRNA synthetase